MRLLIIAAFFLTLSACTTIPEQIQGAYQDISPARVESSVFGADVRWGGIIVATHVEADKSCIEILSRELGKYLRPETNDSTAGRFIGCQPGFLDPMVYAAGREITVTGAIQRIEVKKLEEFDYRYPVVEIDDLVLWEKRKVVMRYRGFNDPFYGPMYGPWYGPPGYWGGPWGGPWGGYPWYPRPYGSYGTGYIEPVELLPGPAVTETPK